MIDKIRFYIKDVDIDELEKKIKDLDIIGLDRIRGVSKYGAKLKDAITITINGKNTLSGSGSLHKYAKGNNYSTFTAKEARKAIIELGETIGIPLNRFIISTLEIGINIPMSKDPMTYINILSYYRLKKWPFTLMKPLSKSSQYHGSFCRLTEYEIKFYDKSFEATHNKKELKKFIPLYILRYEIQLFSKKYSIFGFKNIKPLTADKLLNPRLYNRFCRALRSVFNNIHFDDPDKDYSEKLAEDVRNYIFASSDKYPLFLDYLEKYGTKEDCKNAQTLKKSLEKEFEPLTETINIIELRSKFNRMIDLVSDRKLHKK